MAANPAGVRTVVNIEEHPGPNAPAAAGRKVTARLNSPGFIDGGTREKIDWTREAIIDITGQWSLILEVNADIDPLGTSWTIKEPGNRQWTIQVPAGDPAVPVTLRACLVSDPTAPNPIQAGVSEADFDNLVEVVLPGTYVRLPIDAPTALGQVLVVADIGPPVILVWGSGSSPSTPYPSASKFPSTSLFPKAA